MTKCRNNRIKYQSVEMDEKSEKSKEDKTILKLILGENELCNGEIRDFLLDLISDEIKRTESDPNLKESRKYHVLRSIIRENEKIGEKDKIRDELKEVLRQNEEMDRKTRRKLKDMGFEIYEKGTHFKLVYKEDERYAFTLSRTPSDRRAYLNSFQTASLKIF